MAPDRKLLAVLLLGSVALAGCAQDPPADAPAAPAADGTDALADASDAAAETDATLAAMPHLHDYWNGRERVTILDADYAVDAPSAALWAAFMFYYTKEVAAGGAFVQLPEGQLVFEGTGQLDITATWDDPTVTGLSFAYRDAGSGEFKGWVKAQKGEVVSIPVTPEMTDMPHSKQSRWFFLFRADGAPPVAVGKFHVKMEVVRMRDVALFPPHPDFWNGATELEVLRASGVAKSQQAPQAQLQRHLDPMKVPDDVVPGDKPIPMETTRLVANVTIKAVEPQLKVDGLRLHYRSADAPSFVFDDAGEATAVGEDGKTFTFEIPVEMKQTDNPYRERSDWTFRVIARYASPVPGLPPCGEGCHNAEMRYDLVVTAVRGPQG